MSNIVADTPTVTLWFLIVIALTRRSLAMGREFIWVENVNLLPWFGQAPSWPGMAEGQYPEQYRPYYGYPGYQQYYPQTNGFQPSGVAGSVYPGAQYVQSMPGQATVIQGSHVSHVPTSVY